MTAAEPRVHRHGPVTIYVRPGRSLFVDLVLGDRPTPFAWPFRATLDLQLAFDRENGFGGSARFWVPPRGGRR